MMTKRQVEELLASLPDAVRRERVKSAEAMKRLEAISEYIGQVQERLAREKRERGN